MKEERKAHSTAPTLNPSNGEARTVRSLRVRSQSRLQKEFQETQSYIVRPCLRKQNNVKGCVGGR